MIRKQDRGNLLLKNRLLNMKDLLLQLYNQHDKAREVYDKACDVSKHFENLNERDIRRTHIGNLGTEILVSMRNLEINIQFAEKNHKELMKIFNSDEFEIELYFDHLSQSLRENIINTFLIQTELIFRFYYSKITGKTPGKERNLHCIFALLYDDVVNKWTKEECKLLVLIWTLRNMIHTGGIYFKNVQGHNIEYKGKEYKFEYGKSHELIKESGIMELMLPLLDALKILFLSDKIKNLGYCEDPSIFA